MAAGDGSVWVIGQSAGVLSRIDPAARTVAGTTSVGNEPAAVAVGPDAVWVANGADGTVSKIDPSSGHLEGAFPVGKQPSGIAVAADGRRLGCQRRLGDRDRARPRDGRRDPDCPDRRTAQRGRAGRRNGVRRRPGAAERAPRRHAHARRRERARRLRAADPEDARPASGYSAWELLTVTNDGLLGYSQAGGAETYKVVPDLATGLPTVSDGGLTYTFQLRKEIRYSTGGVVQPADIRREIERALLRSGDKFPKMSPYLAAIEGSRGCLTGKRKHVDLTRGITTSPGSSTVTFHLSKPDPDFLFQLALPDYDAVPASTPLHAQLPLPATGPYKIAGYQPKGVVVLVRNPRFRVWSTAAQPDGYPDRIVERYRYTGGRPRSARSSAGPPTSPRTASTRPGHPTLAASLQTRYSSQLYPAPTLYHLGLWLNTRLAPFNDVRVRHAFNLAVDRDRLAQISGGTIGGEAACQFLPPNVNGYSSVLPRTTGRTSRRPAGSSPSPAPRGSRSRSGCTTSRSGTGTAPTSVSVLRSIGYKARAEFVPHDGRSTWRPDRQAGVGG